jgi:uncharacterized damage-inducible protein DinB
MNAVDVIRRLHEHRMWTSHHLREAVAQLSPEALRQTYAIGQGSIWKSLLHLYAAEYVWLEALSGNETGVAPGDVAGKLPGNQEGPDPIATLERLEAVWSALDARWQNFLTGLTVEALDQPAVRRLSYGKLARQRLTTLRSDVLLHVCTHAAYTTAQLVNMLRQTGVTPLPDPMLISMARQQMGDNR